MQLRNLARMYDANEPWFVSRLHFENFVFVDLLSHFDHPLLQFYVVVPYILVCYIVIDVHLSVEVSVLRHIPLGADRIPGLC